MRRLSTLIALLLLLPCASAGVVPLTLSQLCSGASRIVRGQVVGESVHWQGGMIVTDWTIAPALNLKGSGSLPFQVTVPGGTIAGVTMHAGEAPRLKVGEDVILFLRPGVAECDVYGWFRGKYTIVDGKIREKAGTTADAFIASIQAELRGKEKDK